MSHNIHGRHCFQRHFHNLNHTRRSLRGQVFWPGSPRPGKQSIAGWYFFNFSTCYWLSISGPVKSHRPYQITGTYGQPRESWQNVWQSYCPRVFTLQWWNISVITTFEPSVKSTKNQIICVFCWIRFQTAYLAKREARYTGYCSITWIQWSLCPYCILPAFKFTKTTL